MAADGRTDEAFTLSLELRAARSEANSLRDEAARLRSGLGRSMSHIQLVLSALRDGILLLPPLPPPSVREKMSAREQYRISAAQEFIHHTRQLMGDLKRDFDSSGPAAVVEEGGGALFIFGIDENASALPENQLWAATGDGLGGSDINSTSPVCSSDASLLELGSGGVDALVSPAVGGGASVGGADLGGGGSWETAQSAASASASASTVQPLPTTALAPPAPDATANNSNDVGDGRDAKVETSSTIALLAPAAADGVIETISSATTHASQAAPPPVASASTAIVISAKALGKLLSRAASVAAGSFSLLRTSGLPPLAHEPSLIAFVFSFLTHRDIAYASAVCTTWRAVPLRADLVLWRTVTAAGALAPGVRAGLWQAIAFSAAGGAGGGGSYEEPLDATAVASRADALLLRREPPETDGPDAVPTWPRALLDRLVAHLAGGEVGATKQQTASAVLAAAAPPAPLHAATVAKLLTPWVARTWGVPPPLATPPVTSDGSLASAAGAGAGMGNGRASAGAGAGNTVGSVAPLGEADAALRRVPLTLLAGARGPAARGSDVLSFSRLPAPEALDLGTDGSDTETDVSVTASDAAPASVRLFARYAAAAASNERAAALIRSAKSAAARCVAVRAEVALLRDVLTARAAAHESLPDDFSLQFTAAGDSARAAAVAARRAEAEAGSAVRAAHADAGAADRALVRAVLAARAAWVADVAAAWALKNVALHSTPRIVTGTAARAAAAALVLPCGSIVPTAGVRLPDPGMGHESAAARLLVAKRGGAPVGAASMLSPRRSAVQQTVGAPPPFHAPHPHSHASLSSVASPGSLADAIETLLLAGPPESALDFSPLFPLPARLEALLLSTAAADADAAEEAAVGVSSVMLPAGVAGVAVGGSGIDPPAAPHVFPLGADAEDDSDANALGASLTIPALPFPAAGDLVARDVERTFGDLETIARAGGSVDAAALLGSTTISRPTPLTPALVARLRRRLTQVLLATAAMDRGALGTPYTQGANYVAAFLLRHMAAPAAFWTFSAFFHAPAWALRDVFGAGLWRVGAAFEALHALVPRRLPALSTALRAAAVHPSTFATGWVMTLFSSFDALPPALVAGGVWDSFFTHGWKAVFRATLTILEAVTPDVVRRAPDMGEIVTLLHALPHDCLPPSAAALVRHARHWCVPARLLADIARRYDRRAYPARYVAARSRVRARRVAIARAAAGLTVNTDSEAAATAAAAAAAAAPAHEEDSEGDEEDDEEEEEENGRKKSRLRGFFKQGLGGWSRFVAAVAVPGLSRVPPSSGISGEKANAAVPAAGVSGAGGGGGVCFP